MTRIARGSLMEPQVVSAARALALSSLYPLCRLWGVRLRPTSGMYAHPSVPTRPASFLPQALLIRPFFRIRSSTIQGVADVRTSQLVAGRIDATSATLPPLSAVVLNDFPAAGRGGVDKAAEPVATKSSASPIPPPAACAPWDAVDVHAEPERIAISRTPTASLSLQGLSGIGVRAKPDAPPIAATAIPSALFGCRSMDVVAKRVAKR